MKALTIISKEDHEKEIMFCTEKCIGCGVCAHKCPTGAVRLQRREADEHYPANVIELVQAMLRDQGIS
jgi:ferredoxin